MISFSVYCKTKLKIKGFKMKFFNYWLTVLIVYKAEARANRSRCEVILSSRQDKLVRSPSVPTTMLRRNPLV